MTGQAWELAARTAGVIACVLALGSSRNWNGWDLDPLCAAGPARRWWLRAFALWLGLALLIAASQLEGRGARLAALTIVLVIVSTVAAVVAVVLLGTTVFPWIRSDHVLLRDPRAGGEPRHRAGVVGASLLTARSLTAATAIVMALALESVLLAALLASPAST